MSDSSTRYQHFQLARSQAEWTVEELWIEYFTLGGTFLIFDLDAYLSGLVPMPSGEQDVLTCALNERLADLDKSHRMPFQTAPSDPESPVMRALEQLIGAELPDKWDNQNGTT